MNALDDIAKVKPLTLSREATIFGGVLSHKVTQEPNPQVAFAELPRANLALELLEVSMWCEPSSPLSEETGVELRCPSGMVLLFIFVLKLLEPTTRAGGGARERGQRRCEAAATAS